MTDVAGQQQPALVTLGRQRRRFALRGLLGGLRLIESSQIGRLLLREFARPLDHGLFITGTVLVVHELLEVIGTHLAGNAGRVVLFTDSGVTVALGALVFFRNRLTLDRIARGNQPQRRVVPLEARFFGCNVECQQRKPEGQCNTCFHSSHLLSVRWHRQS